MLPVKATRLDFDNDDDESRNLISQAPEPSRSSSPVFRAVSLAWLAEFAKKHEGTTQSWEVNKEFMVIVVVLTITNKTTHTTTKTF